LQSPSLTYKKLKAHKKLNLALKLLIAALLFYVIYRQLFSRDNAAELFASFKQQLSEGNIFYLIACIILMPINWLLESKKWQILSRNFEPQDMLDSIKTVLGGVVCSLFSPARIGEYGGRVLFVKPENNWKAVTATMVGSLSQLVVVLSVGSLGLISWLGYYAVSNRFSLTALIILWFFFTLLGLGIFYHIDLFINILKRVKVFNRFKSFYEGLKVLNAYRQRDLTKTLSISFVRYLVYSTQYLLLLLFFGINIGLLPSFSGISAIFFIQTGVPLPPIWDLFARGEVAIQIWGIYDANELSILAATFTLWAINLILPSLLGLVFIVKINIIKSIGYGKENNSSNGT